MLTERLSQKKKRNNYKSLYESIMRDVSKVIKKHLNETDDNEDLENLNSDQKNKLSQMNPSDLFLKVIMSLAKNHLTKKSTPDTLRNQIEYSINRYLYPATKYNENKGVLFCKTVKQVCTPQNLDYIEKKLADYCEDNKVKGVEWDNIRKTVTIISDNLWKECEMILRENPNLKKYVNEGRNKNVKKRLNEWITKDIEKPKYKFKVAYVQDAEDGMALIQDDEWIYCHSYGGAYWEAVHLGGKMSPIWDYAENTIWAWPDDGSTKDYVDTKQTPPDFYNEFGYDDIGTIILAPIDY